MMRELQQQTVQVLSETIDTTSSTTAAADSPQPPASAGRGEEQSQHDERPHKFDPPQTDEELSNAAEDALKVDDDGAAGMEDEPMVASEEAGDAPELMDDEEMLGFDDD